MASMYPKMLKKYPIVHLEKLVNIVTIDNFKMFRGKLNNHIIKCVDIKRQMCSNFRYSDRILQ